MSGPRFRSGAHLLALAQGAYFFITGVWPLVHMPSFLAVTGSKTDLWLVQTVGVLIAVIGATLLLAGLARRVTWEVLTLAAGSALGLAGVDVVFVTGGVIPPIYLADAAAEALLIASWLVVAVRGSARPAVTPVARLA